MTSKELSLVVNSFENLENEANSDEVLRKTFDNCQNLFDLIQASNISSSGEEYQNYLQKCIKFLEKCTVMVNELDLFSSNESIEEVQTSCIRYLLLPALLGSLKLSLQNREVAKRLENIQIGEVYFRDFLLRCKNYELCKGKYFEDFEDVMGDTGEAGSNLTVSSSLHCNTSFNPTVQDLALKREKKIEQYKVKKDLKLREEELKSALQRSDADEYVREYYLVLLEKWIITAVEELENIKREKWILKTMAQQRKDISNNITRENMLHNVKPLKPIIITKNEIQKKVFGMGYPSLPVMTIEDFYRQRFEQYIKEQKSSSGHSVQGKAHVSAKENEEIMKEELLEKEDPIELRKAREWDEWKDDNPRGSGNKKNKG